MESGKEKSKIQERLEKLEEELKEVSREFVDKEVPKQEINPDNPYSSAPFGGAEHLGKSITFDRHASEKPLTKAIIPHEYGHAVFRETPIGRVWLNLQERQSVLNELDKELANLQDLAIKNSRDPERDRAINLDVRIEIINEILEEDKRREDKPKAHIEEIENRLEYLKKSIKNLDTHELKTYDDIRLRLYNDEDFLLSVNEGVAFLFDLYYLLKNDDLSYGALRSTADFFDKQAKDYKSPHLRGLRMVTYGIRELEGLIELGKYLPPTETTYGKKVILTEKEKNRLMQVIRDRIRQITYTDNVEDLRELLELKGTPYSRRVERGADLSRYPKDYEEKVEKGMEYLLKEDNKNITDLYKEENYEQLTQPKEKKSKHVVAVAAILLIWAGIMYFSSLFLRPTTGMVTAVTFFPVDISKIISISIVAFSILCFYSFHKIQKSYSITNQ